MWAYSSKDSDDEYSLMIYIPNILDKQELDMCSYWLEQKNRKGLFKTANEVTYNIFNRKQLWFQEDGEYFCKKWKNRYERWESNSYDSYIYGLQHTISKKLKSIFTDKTKVESLKLPFNMESMKQNPFIDTEFDFNSVLVNLYENGFESIRPHRDCIDSFGMYPSIAGLSIGATRVLRLQKIQFNDKNIHSLKPETRKHLSGISMDIPLENNSLFIMMGGSQKYYTHEILKDSSVTCKRYSLTFRKWKG